MLSEKPWKLESVARLFLGVMLCYSIGIILSGLIDPPKSPGDAITILRVVIAILSFQGAALVLIHFFLRAHKTSWRDAFGFTIQWRCALLYGGLAGAIFFFPICYVLQIASAKLMTQLNHAHHEQAVVQALGLVHNWRERITMTIIAVIIVPIAEEMLFRGILYPFIKQNGYPRLAILGVSALFALVHFDLEKFPALFALALLLTWLYERTNNLLAPITAHSLFNAANLVAYYFQEPLNQFLNRFWHFLHLA